jgi:hypothetical protein
MAFAQEGRNLRNIPFLRRLSAVKSCVSFWRGPEDLEACPIRCPELMYKSSVITTVVKIQKAAHPILPVQFQKCGVSKE